MERISIVENGREVSHLAVRFDPPPHGAGSAGDRPCFLYLHGFGSEQAGEKAEFFRARALAAGFGFCSFDFQGHGRSGGEMGHLTLTRNLEDVARVHALLRERGCGRLILAGSSMGGGTALWYSMLHPEEIVAGLHIAPALEMEKGLLAWAGAERARAWQETGSVQFRNELRLLRARLGPDRGSPRPPPRHPAGRLPHPLPPPAGKARHHRLLEERPRFRHPLHLPGNRPPPLRRRRPPPHRPERAAVGADGGVPARAGVG